MKLHFGPIVSCPDPPSAGCGEREKEGLGLARETTWSGLYTRLLRRTADLEQRPL